MVLVILPVLAALILLKLSTSCGITKLRVAVLMITAGVLGAVMMLARR